MKYDKQLTRWAAETNTPTLDIIMFGKRWTLQQFGIYRVRFNRRHPSRSEILELA